MPHLKGRAVILYHTVVFLLLTQCCAAQSHGPPQPVVAALGGEVILPCHLEPSVDASDMTVEWSRPGLDPRFIYVWRDGVELERKQHPSYKGRTSVPTDSLRHGDISLTLSKVKISDEGTYRCFVPTLDRESTVELAVGAAPFIVISLSKTDSSEVVLQCESQGWYPEPEVFWLDGEGNLLSAGPTETVRGPDGLYTVSRRLTVEKSDNFTCRVQQKNIKQTRETHFNVPDDFFSSSAHISISIGVGLVVVFMVILAAVFAVWKKNKKKQEECVLTLQHEVELKNQRDKLRSQLEALKREWTEKKYDCVSRFQTEEQEAKKELQQKITELETKLKKIEDRKTSESGTERTPPEKTRVKIQSSQGQSSQSRDSDENTEFLSAGC